MKLTTNELAEDTWNLPPILYIGTEDDGYGGLPLKCMLWKGIR
jgi:hypothetical protein